MSKHPVSDQLVTLEDSGIGPQQQPTGGDQRWDYARAVADAVLYEGYLLYPYRADAPKNRSRWQFGVLGPDHAGARGLGEDDSLQAQCLIQTDTAARENSALTLAVRFLQLQRRSVFDSTGAAVAELTVAGQSWLCWDEAVAHELMFAQVALSALAVSEQTFPIDIAGDVQAEDITDAAGVRAGRLVRTRHVLTGQLRLRLEPAGDYLRLTVALRNVGSAASDAAEAIARSFLGTHVVAEIAGGVFVSLLEPPDAAAAAVRACAQHRCFPVLAGPSGNHELLLISPIILYDHPEIASQSTGPLFDSTEIDELLTLRVMTMTEAEKQRARATDAQAAAIIDRCDATTEQQLWRLHGVLRDPLGDKAVEQYASEVCDPDTDAVTVAGVSVRKGSRVRLRPSRRADAHDVFYAGALATVAAVHRDLDGGCHVAVVLADDPAADLHEWYGRYLYFAPEEIEPVTDGVN